MRVLSAIAIFVHIVSFFHCGHANLDLCTGFDDNFFNVFVFGSSVAVGVGATANQGYAFMLGEEIQEKFGQKLMNKAVSGSTTGPTLSRVRQVLGALDYVPQVVILGLSTANEGLVGATTQAQADAVANQFEKGIETIINTTLAIGVETVIVGSVYPQNNYNAMHYGVLKGVFNRALVRLPQLGIAYQKVVVADFLTTLDDGNGRWKDGIFRDAGHPNDAGHSLMLASLNQSFYQAVNLPSFATATLDQPCPSSAPSISTAPSPVLNDFTFPTVPPPSPTNLPDTSSTETPTAAPSSAPCICDFQICLWLADVLASFI